MSESEWFARIRRAVNGSQRDVSFIADEETPKDPAAIAELAERVSVRVPDLTDPDSIAFARKELVGIAYRVAQEELAE